MNEDLKQHMIESLDKGTRYDGRKLDEYREIKIETGLVKTAEGSARVCIGDTEVITGIKLEIDKPFSDRPEDGVIMVGAELLPLSSPDFESGPPSEQAIELARVVDRGIRESNAVDLKKLCITKGEKCWLVSVDIVSVNDAGNLWDAAALSAVAALQDTKFPEVEDGVINYKKLTNKTLKLSKVPISVTVTKIGKHLVIDPSIEEEGAIDARITVATIDDGKLCALQKGGDTALSVDEIREMIELGMKKTLELRKLLK
ncbi:exosome complex protein Rrp42 [Candidatus Woesearchaeota archaeon]|nr:exosome complex protein Rrp42 [Candidatus Woesearchaeota archaeon]